MQTLRGELANVELQRGDAEGQLQQLQQVRPGGPLSIGMPRVVFGMGWGTHSTSPQLTQPPVKNHGSSGPHSHYTQREPYGLRCFPTWALQLGTVGQHLCSQVSDGHPEVQWDEGLLACLQVLRQRQEGEAMALRSVQKLQEERRLLQERLGSLQRALAQLEAEKREVERSALRLDKDRVALRKTLDKVACSAGTSLGFLCLFSVLLLLMSDYSTGAPVNPL